jgi:predicted XRE-type DNA-binding protein
MPKRSTKSTHPATSSVFEDMGFSPEEAAVLELKTTLHIEIMREIKRRKLTSRRLEKILDVPQPRVSELVSGKISKMTVDRLTIYLHRLGRKVNVTTKKAKLLESAVA